jgi:hypothetical protein
VQLKYPYLERSLCMNKKFGWILGALVVALVAVGAYGITSASADDGDPPLQLPERFGPGGHHGGPRLDGAALEAVAGVLNMDPEAVTAALEDGKTLQDLADDAGVDMGEIKDALDGVRAEAIRERITQALENETITQEHADWLLEGLDKGFLNGPGFNFGFRGHHRVGPAPEQTE